MYTFNDKKITKFWRVYKVEHLFKRRFVTSAFDPFKVLKQNITCFLTGPAHRVVINSIVWHPSEFEECRDSVAYMILHHIYWDSAHHGVFIRSRLVILPPCLPLVSATGISKPSLFKFSLLRWLELGNFIMLTFQLFIVGIPSCYSVLTSIGDVRFDFIWKECNIARPTGWYGVWSLRH